MWLFEELVSTNNVRDKTIINYSLPGTQMFGVKKYSDILLGMTKEKDIKVNYQKELVKIDVENKIAHFKSLNSADNSAIVQEKYDVLHVTPPLSAPKFLKDNLLSDENGFIDIDKYTMQSKKYKNVFAVGN